MQTQRSGCRLPFHRIRIHVEDIHLKSDREKIDLLSGHLLLTAMPYADASILNLDL